MIVPSDSSHDFTPTEPSLIQVGQEVVLQYEMQGVVFDVIDGPSSTVFGLNDSDGNFLAYAYTPTSQTPPTAWQRIYTYRRTAKPAVGAQFTAADGSEWVYPALPHGLYRCWQAGTTHQEGLGSRADIDGLTSALPDADWDWLPVEAGDINLDDYLLWAIGYQITVTTITQTPVDGGTKYTFSDGTNSVYVYDPTSSGPAGWLASQYIVTAHPSVGAQFQNRVDASMWVFRASKHYYCWKAGTTYPLGALVDRATVQGQLVPA